MSRSILSVDPWPAFTHARIVASLTVAGIFWKMFTRSAVPSVDLIQTSLLPVPPEKGTN